MKKCNQIILMMVMAALLMPKQGWHFATHIPDIIRHLQHHITQHPNETILDFFVLHLLDNEHSDTEHPDHENLPWKHRHASDYKTTLSLAFVPNRTCLEEPTHGIIDTFQTLCNNNFHTDFAASIWQPPKLS